MLAKNSGHSSVCRNEECTAYFNRTKGWDKRAAIDKRIT